MKIGFDNKKYVKIQSEKIKQEENMALLMIKKY